MDGEQPKLTQLYMFDNEQELTNRKMALQDSMREKNLNDAILEGLKLVVNEVNPYAQGFRSACQRF